MSSTLGKTVIPDATFGKSEIIEWNWTGLKNFDICFCIIFPLLLPQSLFNLEKWLDTRLCFQPNLSFSNIC